MAQSSSSEPASDQTIHRPTSGTIVPPQSAVVQRPATKSASSKEPPKTTEPWWQNRWLGLGVLSLALAIAILDSSILNIAIPTIVKEFDASLSDLQWVISGYSLVVATLLITFGRMGDLYGRKKMFMIGAALFAVGSYLASISYSSLDLFLGDSLIEGIGAAMMLPATLSLISSMFRGRERGMAFAVWGAIAGAAGAFGPLLGGWLTTDFSWRWAFLINVFIAPIAFLGAWLTLKESKDTSHRPTFDLPGVLTASIGLFGIVFACIEGDRFGWWQAKEVLTIGSWQWTNATSFIPLIGAVGALSLLAFIRIEQHLEQRGGQPLFALSLLRFKGFQFGLITTLILSLGEFGLVFVLPVFLQTARGLSAVDTGLALLPLGISVIAAAPLAGFLSHRFGPKWVITTGMMLEALGVFWVSAVFAPSATVWHFVPGLIVYGIGIGLATTQLTNVVLSDIPVAKSGIASGVNGTTRQVGAALGIAIIGSILSSQITSHVQDKVDRLPGLPPAIRQQLTNNLGSQTAAASGQTVTGPLAVTIRQVLDEGVSEGSRSASEFASLVIFAGALLSLAIPNTSHHQE